MVEVATGGSGDSNVQSYRCKGKPVEILPMLFRVPKLLFNSNPTDAFDVCYSNVDSLLGFGDVMIPGLLVSYSFAYDLIRKVPYKLYFVASSISYVVGLITTFTGKEPLKTEQQTKLINISFSSIVFDERCRSTCPLIFGSLYTYSRICDFLGTKRGTTILEWTRIFDR